MRTVKHFIWQIVPDSTPLFKKKCSRCKSVNYFYCSDRFRMNSQKRYTDVWLIYRCEKCDNTHYVTILSRTRPELIDRDLYDGFMINDERMAWRYAFDMETMRKNNIEADHSRIEYEIRGEVAGLKDMAGMVEDVIEIRIGTDFDLELKLTTLIRRCFDISLNGLDYMLCAGVLSVLPSVGMKKARVRDGIRILIYRDRLREYMRARD